MTGPAALSPGGGTFVFVYLQAVSTCNSLKQRLLAHFQREERNWRLCVERRVLRNVETECSLSH